MQTSIPSGRVDDDAEVVIIDSVPYRVLSCDEYHFIGELEDEPGAEVRLEYSDVDLSRDLIYKLTLVDTSVKQK